MFLFLALVAILFGWARQPYEEHLGKSILNWAIFSEDIV